MGTLMQDAKRNKAKVSTVVNLITNDVYKAHAKRIQMTWYDNQIFCRISGKKFEKEQQYSGIDKGTVEIVVKRLKEKNFKLTKREGLELQAERLFLKKT